MEIPPKVAKVAVETFFDAMSEGLKKGAENQSMKGDERASENGRKRNETPLWDCKF